VSVGSATTGRSTHQGDDRSISASRHPLGRAQRLAAALNYSPTSEIPFPIPGIAYLGAVGDSSWRPAGVPVFVITGRWKDWFLTLSYVRSAGPHAGSPRLGHGGVRRLQLGNESGSCGRGDDRDRLFYYDQRVTRG